MSADLSWIKKAHLAFQKALADSLSEYGLTATQLEVLATIAHTEGIEHRTLLEGMGITSPTLTTIIDGLVQHGYIERRISPDDARVKLLYLTEAGRHLWQEVDGKADPIFEQLIEGFSPGELTLLAEMLERFTRNAQKISNRHKTHS